MFVLCLHLQSADSSDEGIYISAAECLNLTAPPPMTYDNESIPVDLVQRYCARWNNTFHLWNAGVRSQSDTTETNFIPFDEYTARWTQLQNDVAVRSRVSSH